MVDRNTLPTIVYVEDEIAIINLLRESLTMLKMPVNLIGVNNVNSGLQIIRSQRPDLIILDLMLPGRSGWDLVYELRSDPLLADLPVIILSVKRPEDETVEGFPVGQVQEFMTKPFSVIELGNKIKQYLPTT
ncbi:MAG: response regulator [Anaerolineae bacterium]|nr:response regulator [Anaerolineae bacterium]